MSVIGKKPFVNKIVDTCSKEQTQQIIDLMNHLGNPTLVALYGCDNLIGPANIGVSYVTLKMNQLLAQIVNGILVYIDDTHCGFFGITSNSDNIDEFEIDPVNKTYNKIRENLTVEELRQVCGDRLVEVGGNITVQADDIDSGSATEGQTLVADGQGGAVWGEAGGGLPEATKAGQVLVSNEDLQFEERDAVPMADNLTSVPETNDTMYSAGPTGGLADIYTGEEAYLQEVKGYSIVWNQLLDANHGHTCVSGHYYIYYNGSSFSLIGPNSTNNYSQSSTNKLFDLTLMFGGNDKIPFSLVQETEYSANGDMLAQTYYAKYGFQRFFANVDLYNASYDAGTIKNVKTSKLTETGKNLYDSATMNGISPLLLAGYRYEIYFINGTSSNQIAISKDGISFPTSTNLERYKLGNGKYIYTYTPGYNCYIKSGFGNTNNPIVYVGFVHSGNYCLTTGNNTNLNAPYTDATIPAYQKHEFAVSGIDGLNGIPDSSENHCSVYDTVDTIRVKSVDLSTLTWTAGEGAFSAEISDIKADTTNLLATQYLGSEMSVSGTTITITTTVYPTGTLLYELATPVATGQPAFEPIPLKDSQGNWVVNDMGFEYFTGLDICPVNQVSYYYENLKDKIVNLKIPEIKNVPFNYENEALTGLQIDGSRYNVCSYYSLRYQWTTSGTPGYYYNLGIGVNPGTPSNLHRDNKFIGTALGSRTTNCYSIFGGGAGESSSNCVLIAGGTCGQSSDDIVISGASYRGKNVVIGCNAKAGYSNAYGSATGVVAIGYGATSQINYSVSFDSTDSTYQRTILLYDPTKIFFRNDVIHNTDPKWNYSKYTSGHFLNEYVQNNVMVSDGAKYYTEYTDADNYKTFTGNKASGTFTAIDKLITGVHITLKLSTDVVVGIDLLPYDTANSKHFTGYGIASDTPTFVSAYIDSDGTVVINPPSGVTVVEATYNIR